MVTFHRSAQDVAPLRSGRYPAGPSHEQFLNGRSGTGLPAFPVIEGVNMHTLQQQDPDIFNLIRQEEIRQKDKNPPHRLGKLCIQGGDGGNRLGPNQQIFRRAIPQTLLRRSAVHRSGGKLSHPAGKGPVRGRACQCAALLRFSGQPGSVSGLY